LRAPGGPSGALRRAAGRGQLAALVPQPQALCGAARLPAHAPGPRCRLPTAAGRFPGEAPASARSPPPAHLHAVAADAAGARVHQHALALQRETALQRLVKGG
jgi:hypothetical protein